MSKVCSNYVFIDGQNLYLGVKSLGWKLDYARLAVYLRESYQAQKILMFLGFLPEQEPLYTNLRSYGYEIIFKEVSHDKLGKPKGNVDVLLTLHTVLKKQDCAKVVLITSDGDFAPLVDWLVAECTLRAVLSPKRDTCSRLLRKSAGGFQEYLDECKDLLEMRQSGV